MVGEAAREWTAEVRRREPAALTPLDMDSVELYVLLSYNGVKLGIE